ncbi:hypothetical protein C0J52_10905 [Blattella germanica]|nr:hypothetical protein C0J52_10905 [Blattella germanica]
MFFYLHYPKIYQNYAPKPSTSMMQLVDTLHHVSNELVYRLDVCRVRRRAHIEHL